MFGRGGLWKALLRLRRTRGDRLARIPVSNQILQKGDCLKFFLVLLSVYQCKLSRC